MSGRPRRALAAWVLVGVAASCTRESPPSVLVPVVRVVDALRPVRDGKIVHGADASFDRESRRTVLAPAEAIGVAARSDDAKPSYRVTTWPDAARAWGAVRLLNARLGGQPRPMSPIPFDAAGDGRTLPLMPTETAERDALFLVYPAMGTHDASVETEPFAVPSGAVLRFHSGVRALGARLPRSVGARVAVIDGDRRHVVWRARLPGMREAWRHEEVPLDAFAERTIRLRFTTQTQPLDRAGMWVAFGEPLVLAPRPSPVRPFDVVLVSLDTLRARSVGAYGADRRTSPMLDSLAADGAMFENAFSTAAFTLPGHMSMLTGLWLRTHGTFTAEKRLSASYRTLAEVLQSAGYATAAFTSDGWIVPWAGFRRGFDTYHELGPSSYGEDQPGGTPYESFTRGLAWLAENADRPCFVFLHNYVVHAPYRPPRAYAALFGPSSAFPSEAETKRLAYEQEVRYADDQVRALLEGLEALGRAERTLVVVTADHGEQFGEHGGFEHTYDVHDEVARVPLIMRLPGAIAAGLHVVEPVSLADVAPTIVDVLGLPPIPNADGTSLLPLLGTPRARLSRPAVFTEAESEPNLGWIDLVGVHTRERSCMRSDHSGADACYDAPLDPWQERDPLPRDDASAESRAARAALARFVASKAPPDTRVEPDEPIAETPADAEAGPTGMTPERREQLRALGYVE